MITILWYLAFSKSKSFPTPQPNAVIIFLISSDDNILSNLDFSTFNILPLNGSIACVCLSLPCLAEPPAESPSTKNISLLEGSFSAQSANFPGNEVLSNTLFLLVNSLALLAASLALWALRPLSTIILAVVGFSSKKAPNSSTVTLSTIPLITVFPSLVFVWPSNWGSGSLTDTTVVRPSLISSPNKFGSFSFKSLFLLAYSFIVFVRAVLNPAKWVPPSWVFILLAKEYMFSE